MRPVTDKHKVSRAKLAYIIDATAAPVCIIAPISSWAAAVAGFAEDGQGFNLFMRAIPYNYYALLTIVMMVGMVLMKVEFGPMAKFEDNARENGDLFSGPNPYAMMEEEVDGGQGPGAGPGVAHCGAGDLLRHRHDLLRRLLLRGRISWTPSPAPTPPWA